MTGKVGLSLRHGSWAARVVLWGLLCVVAVKARAAGDWDQPAAQLADRVAALLGEGVRPAQAQLVILNRSTIAATSIPAIRRLLVQGLRTHGIQSTAATSATLLRVTLSENARQRLWIAEVVQGGQTQVAMVDFDRPAPAVASGENSILLAKKRVWSSLDRMDGASASDSAMRLEAAVAPVLAALEMPFGLVLLEQDRIVILARTDNRANGWREVNRFLLAAGDGAAQPLSIVPSRDPRGLLVPSSEENRFTAFTAGMVCDGAYTRPAEAAGQSGIQSDIPSGGWSLRCRQSDDPLPITASAIAQKAFYNVVRNFYTGVIAPSGSDDPMPFYSVAALPSGAKPAVPGDTNLLVGGMDGKVRVLEGQSARSIGGTRDWGSDFAAVHTDCGAGLQIVASQAGEAQSDTLRAYDLIGQEALEVSAPIEMGGTVTALWSAPDGRSVWAVVGDNSGEYEVDRVTAICP